MLGRTYEELKKDARLACKVRGHFIRRINTTSWTEAHGHRGAAKCEKCPAYVQVIQHPAPNEIDIGGPAVAMDCPTDPKWC